MTLKRNTRALLVALVVVALLVTSLTFVACNKDKGNNLRKASDVYALAGVSTGALLSSMDTASAAMAGELVEDEAIINELNEYMALVDSLVSGVPANSEVKASDRAEYAKMQEISVPNMDGTFTKYALYYSEDGNVALSDEEDEEEEEEDEYESHITGVMVIEGKEYPIKGDIEREADEQEIEFKAYLTEDKKDYIVFSQEIEANESEFEYEIYKNNEFVNSFSLELETENAKSEFEIEIENAAGEAIEYEVEKEEGGKIKVEYTKNGTKGTFEVEATKDANGNPVYKYYLKDKEIEKDRD